MYKPLHSAWAYLHSREDKGRKGDQKENKKSQRTGDTTQLAGRKFRGTYPRNRRNCVMTGWEVADGCRDGGIELGRK
jgi:hypothetical protein